MTPSKELFQLLEEIHACTACAGKLPMPPRPVIRAQTGAILLIVGQAPGLLVHETGIPWNDPSGDRLRQWLELDRSAFYDETRIAIMPVGLCYPGRSARGGDLPPRPECMPLWRSRVLALLPDIRLTLLIGSFAQQTYLGDRVKSSLTETVKHWQAYSPEYIPLPHPSFRNLAWLKKNPWFQEEVVPCIRERVHALLAY